MEITKRCFLCRKDFTTFEELINHINSHPEFQKYIEKIAPDYKQFCKLAELYPNESIQDLEQEIGNPIFPTKIEDYHKYDRLSITEEGVLLLDELKRISLSEMNHEQQTKYLSLKIAYALKTHDPEMLFE